MKTDLESLILPEYIFRDIEHCGTASAGEISSIQFRNPTNSNPSPSISYQRPKQCRYGISRMWPKRHWTRFPKFSSTLFWCNSRDSGNCLEFGSVEFAEIRLNSGINRNTWESVGNLRTEFLKLDGSDSAMFNITE